MAIRKLRVSFDIDVETFAKVLALGNSGMNIEVYGTGDASASPSRVNHTVAVARVGHRKEHPAKKQMVILEALAKKEAMHLNEISVLCKKAGFAASINSCMNTMLNAGTVTRVGPGLYAATDRGVSYVNA
jgi:hypothetical protein